jgi:ribosomal protein L37E
MNDKLVVCRKCGSDACYEVQGEDIISWSCMGCGFSTNTYMMSNTEIIKEFDTHHPELIKDIKFTDKEGLVWYPIILNTPEIGIIFPDGTSAKNWKWAFAPAVKIPESEKQNYPVAGAPGKFQEYRIDMKKVKHFDQRNYIGALEEAKIL